MKVQQQGPSSNGDPASVSRRDLFHLLHSKAASRDTLHEHLVTALRLHDAPPHVLAHVKREASRFYSGFLARWKKCRSTKARFLQSNAVWLDVEMRAGDLVAGADRYEAIHPPKPPRPPKEHKSKKKPIPKRVRIEGAGAIKKTKPQLIAYSPEDALDNLVIKANLSKNQYVIMRECAHQLNCFIYPSFQAIHKVMEERAKAGGGAEEHQLPKTDSDDGDGYGGGLGDEAGCDGVTHPTTTPQDYT